MLSVYGLFLRSGVYAAIFQNSSLVMVYLQGPDLDLMSESTMAFNQPRG